MIRDKLQVLRYFSRLLPPANIESWERRGAVLALSATLFVGVSSANTPMVTAIPFVFTYRPGQIAVTVSVVSNPGAVPYEEGKGLLGILGGNYTPNAVAEAATAQAVASARQALYTTAKYIQQNRIIEQVADLRQAEAQLEKVCPLVVTGSPTTLYKFKAEDVTTCAQPEEDAAQNAEEDLQALQEAGEASEESIEAAEEAAQAAEAAAAAAEATAEEALEALEIVDDIISVLSL